MNTLENLEKEFGFTYPAIYKKLAENQMLDMSKASADWLNLVYPKLKDNPSLLLYAYDFELIDLDEVQGLIEELRDPDDYRNVNPDYLFVPFAMTYGGDWYCFWYHFPKEIEAGEPLIVLLPHDDYELEILAKNLEDFIFAQLCQSVCDVYEEGLIMDGDFRQNITNMLRTHSPFLSDERKRIVAELYEREWMIDSDDESIRGLISKEDLDTLLEQEISFDYLNQTYPFEIEEDTSPVALQKISGMVYLSISPIPEKDSPVYQMVKELNWRHKKAISTHLEYTKKYEFFTRFTTPKEQFAEMLDPFLTRLKMLKTLTDFELIFIDSQSQEMTILNEWI